MLPDGELICVAFLTDTERELILEVLRRDEELRQAEEQRVRRLKSELLAVKKRGAKHGSRYDHKRSCARCQEPLSPLGAGYCHGCNHQVCSNCRVVRPDGFWVCNVCAKEADLKKSTGNWFYDQRVNRFSRSPGHSMVQASLRKRPPLKMRETVGKVLLQSSEMNTAEPVPQDRPTDQLNFEGTVASEPSKTSNPFEVGAEQHSDVQLSESSIALWKESLDAGHTGRSRCPGFQESNQTVPAKEGHAYNSTSDQTSTLDRVNPCRGNIFFEDEGLFKISTKRARKHAEYSKPTSMLDLHEESTEVLGRSMGNRSKSVPGLSVQEKEEEDIDNLVKFHRSSISKSSLGSITSMYSQAGDYMCVEVTGNIVFSLAYDECTRTLSVLIKECHNLAYGEAIKQRTNPYVKCYLLPGKSHHNKKKTSIKRHTVNPAYNENLKFSICQSQLLMRTLLLSVWHYDLFGHNAFLGEVELPLDCKDLDSPHEECIALRGKVMPHTQPSAFAQYRGRLVVSLKYVTTDTPSTDGAKALSFLRKKKSGEGELHIHIKEARDLIPVKAGAALDSFVKGYLLPAKRKAAKKKTPVVRMTLNPHYDHTFIYKDLSLELLKSMSLELTVWGHETMSSNNFLGGVRLNSGTEERSGSTEEVCLWQKMMQYPDSWAEGALPLYSSMGHSN
ncbi:synaptotagmin-like protein 4 isoform X1 [Anguilla rostrata]|uniref:synaptotagmin-like protein 4 isoform X1 n=1 Tax=Anguilla rostrata TaxID=7938 RepID=UPI0030D5AA9A